MFVNTQQMTKKHNDIILKYYRRQEEMLTYRSSFYKMCPNCGTFLPYNSKGCDKCLFQFNRSIDDKDRC